MTQVIAHPCKRTQNQARNRCGDPVKSSSLSLIDVELRQSISRSQRNQQPGISVDAEAIGGTISLILHHRLPNQARKHTKGDYIGHRIELFAHLSRHTQFSGGKTIKKIQSRASNHHHKTHPLLARYHKSYSQQATSHIAHGDQIGYFLSPFHINPLYQYSR